MRYIGETKNNYGVRCIAMRSNINNYTESVIDDRAEGLLTLLTFR
jgi:hypothetical protein